MNPQLTPLAIETLTTGSSDKQTVHNTPSDFKKVQTDTVLHFSHNSVLYNGYLVYVILPSTEPFIKKIALILGLS